MSNSEILIELQKGTLVAKPIEGLKEFIDLCHKENLNITPIFTAGLYITRTEEDILVSVHYTSCIIDVGFKFIVIYNENKDQFESRCKVFRESIFDMKTGEIKEPFNKTNFWDYFSPNSSEIKNTFDIEYMPEFINQLRGLKENEMVYVPILIDNARIFFRKEDMIKLSLNHMNGTSYPYLSVYNKDVSRKDFCSKDEIKIEDFKDSIKFDTVTVYFADDSKIWIEIELTNDICDYSYYLFTWTDYKK